MRAQGRDDRVVAGGASSSSVMVTSWRSDPAGVCRTGEASRIRAAVGPLNDKILRPIVSILDVRELFDGGERLAGELPRTCVLP